MDGNRGLCQPGMQSVGEWIRVIQCKDNVSLGAGQGRGVAKGQEYHSSHVLGRGTSSAHHYLRNAQRSLGTALSCSRDKSPLRPREKRVSKSYWGES